MILLERKRRVSLFLSLEDNSLPLLAVKEKREWAKSGFILLLVLNPVMPCLSFFCCSDAMKILPFMQADNDVDLNVVPYLHTVNSRAALVQKAGVMEG